MNSNSRNTGSRRGYLIRLDSHHRVLIALVVAALVYLLMLTGTPVVVQLTVTWSVFALVSLVLAWGVIVLAHPADVRRSATLQDAGITAVFVVVLIGTIGSLTAVGALLGAARGLHGQMFISYVLISTITVILSWLLMHTIFTLRYAHIYHGTGEHAGSVHGGLSFPGRQEPDFLDFAYFSFVIGATAQVSDVQVTSHRLRRLVLVHGVVSFVFNTVILAMTINVVSSLTLG